MKKTIIVGALVLSGCSQQPTYLEMRQMLEDVPQAESLVKIIIRNNEYHNYDCTAASIGKGLFLTTSACIGRGMSIYGLGGQQHRPEVIKEGHDYNGQVDIINNTDQNYAILYAPELILPALPLAKQDMAVEHEYCLSYLTQKYANYRELNHQKIEPIKVCGKSGNRDDAHQSIRWNGELETQNGYWGGPVLNSQNEIVGILSYRYTNDFQRSGVLRQSIFSDDVKKILAK